MINNEYDLKFFDTPAGSPQIRSGHKSFEIVANLGAFFRIEELTNEIVPFAKNTSNIGIFQQREWIKPVGDFLRISNKKVQFGQYVDENLAELDQFRECFDNGEKIFGEIPITDFLLIVESWLFYLKNRL